MSPAVKAPSKTKTKAKSSKKETTAPRKPRAYPTYHEMAKEAILALKERTGSSQIAIAKYIEEKQKSNLPANFKKLLLVQLKKLVAAGRLVKVKNSYKVPSKTSSSSAPVEKPTKKPAKKVEAKPKTVTKKQKTLAEKKPKKAVKAAPVKKKASADAKKVKKTPVKAAKKPKSIKSPVKGVKKAKSGKAVKKA